MDVLSNKDCKCSGYSGKSPANNSHLGFDFTIFTGCNVATVVCFSNLTGLLGIFATENYIFSEFTKVLATNRPFFCRN